MRLTTIFNLLFEIGELEKLVEESLAQEEASPKSQRKKRGAGSFYLEMPRSSEKPNVDFDKGNAVPETLWNEQAVGSKSSDESLRDTIKSLSITWQW